MLRKFIPDFHPVRKAVTLFSTFIFNLKASHRWGHRWLLVVVFLFLIFFLKSFPVYVDLKTVAHRVFHSLYFHSYIWFCRLVKLFDQHFLCLTVNNLRRSGLNFLRMSATKMSVLTVGKRIWAKEMQEKAEVKQQQKKGVISSDKTIHVLLTCTNKAFLWNTF